MRSLLVASSAMLLLLAGGATANLETELAAKETRLKLTASSAAAYFQSRCNALSDTTCSQPACGSTFKTSDGFTCLSGMGDSCGADCPGMTRSEEESTVWVPRETSFTSADPQAFVASTRSADTLMKSARSASSGALKAWQLIGDTTGVTRVFPGNPEARDEGTCENYDARTRPWYVAAASGPKDLVIVIDVSGSMTDRSISVTRTSREDLVRPAVHAVLNTLTQNDYVTLITFSSDANTLTTSRGASSRMQGTNENIEAIKAAWDAFDFGGATYYGKAFTKAFAELAKNDDATSGCSKIIMFLTDGEPTDAFDYRDAITNGQASLNGANASIFTVTMGSTVSDITDVTKFPKPKEIACSNQGVYQHINDGDDPLVALRGYYQFLAAGLTSGEVRWSNPYIDAFGLGQMVTAGMPIFDESGSLKQLVGVAGADVTVAELEATGVSFQGILNELIRRSKTCPTTNFSTCILQQLRKNTGYECPGQISAAQCETAGDVFVRTPCSTTRSLNDYLCESLTESGTGASKVLKSAKSLTTNEVQCCTEIEGYTGSTEGCAGAAQGATTMAALLVSAVLMVVKMIF